MTRRVERPVEKLAGSGTIVRHARLLAAVDYSLLVKLHIVERLSAEGMQQTPAGLTVSGMLTVHEGERDLSKIDHLELHLADRRWLSVLVLKGDPASGRWHVTLGTGGSAGFEYM